MSRDGDVKFMRYGRSHHLVVATADQLSDVLELDNALWVATNAPIDQINADAVFLKLMDSDANGRIMCFEIRRAIRWSLRNLSDLGGVTSGCETLRLGAINTRHAEGQGIHDSAVRILANLDEPAADEITLEQVRRIKARIQSIPVSEEGVVLPEAAGDQKVRQFIADIIATAGSVRHPGGEEGVGEKQLDDFIAGARAYLDWWSRGQLAGAQEKSDVCPLGAGTGKAFATLSALEEKLVQYFAQCEAVALDERLGERIGLYDEKLKLLNLDDTGAIDEMLRDAPLARPRGDRRLVLTEPINPRYAEKLSELRAKVLEPILGGKVNSLSQDQWQRVQDAFASHRAWAAAVAEKAGAAVGSLGAQKLSAYLDGPFVRDVRSLISDSAETAFATEDVRVVERLILYQAHLLELVNNFVAFPHLYDAEKRAMFEMGSLVIDGRNFNFAVKVTDRAAHVAVTKAGSMYLLYLEITCLGSDPYEVVVPVTSGGKGNLVVGKRGVFRDLDGNECDARVVHIIENPISVREAMIAPFQRIGRLIGGKIEKISTVAEKKLDTTAATAMTRRPTAQTPAPARPGGGLLAGGLLMGGGFAIAALGSAVAYITKTLAGVGYLPIVVAVGVAILAVIVPTSIVAILKLRRRDLSVILEASGWGINARMRLSGGQGRFFTRRPRHPLIRRGLRRWWWGVLVAVLVAGVGAVVWGLWKS